MRSAFDSIFDLPPTPPFPLGTSPFRARGRVHKLSIELATQLVPGGLDAVFRKAPDAALERFMRQSFTAGSFYDVFPVVYFERTLARVSGTRHELLLQRLNHQIAADATSGFTGIVLRAFSTENVALWLPRVSGWFHEFGSVHTEIAGPGYIRGRRLGTPQPLVGIWSRAAVHFTEEVLRRVGARGARALVLAPERDGQVHGVTTYAVPFEVRWSP
jgi:hypothetical protein